MTAAAMSPERVAHDIGHDLAEWMLRGVEAAADDDCEAFGELQQGLLKLADLLQQLKDTEQFDERYMMAGGFASAVALPLMLGLRAEAAEVLLRVSLKGAAP
jgi:hypothetical protein